MSRMFEWKNDFATGIGSIDAQHQSLFAIGRELYAAMSEGQGKTVLGRILERLVQYTTVHFAHEERLMKRHSYPGFAVHKAQHDALIKQVLGLQTEYQAGRATLAVPVLHFLKDWLEKHIQKTDMAYIECLKANKAA
ncbi:MAG: bacteriohemerythrin [Candidatus Solibacter sp.]